jgi:aryl-alcohol dehydrogenase-like predicted oxidoreductase
MHYRQLGKHGPKVSTLGLGCMSISSGHYGQGDALAGSQVIQEAYAQGLTFFDTADMYGKGDNEIVVGKAIKHFRKHIILATKCALEYTPEGLRINNNPKYIQSACESSLKRLETDHIDLYYLHRYTPEIPIEESMAAMQALIDQGKISYVGLSEVGPDILERAQAVLGTKLVALQSEYSMVNRTVAEKILPTCRKLGISFVAFSPITRGLLSGKITNRLEILQGGQGDLRSSFPQFEERALEQNLGLVNAIATFAKKKQATPAQIALAWLLAQGNDVIPIPGTKKLPYLKENLGAIHIALSKTDLQELDDIMKAHPTQGTRYPEALMRFSYN